MHVMTVLSESSNSQEFSFFSFCKVEFKQKKITSLIYQIELL